MKGGKLGHDNFYVDVEEWLEANLLSSVQYAERKQFCKEIKQVVSLILYSQREVEFFFSSAFWQQTNICPDSGLLVVQTSPNFSSGPACGIVGTIPTHWRLLWALGGFSFPFALLSGAHVYHSECSTLFRPGT